MGPLAGTKITIIKEIGPGPYTGQILGDLGEEGAVECASKSNSIAPPLAIYVNSRSNRSIAFDQRKQEGFEDLMNLAEQADEIFEGNRPGATEKLCALQAKRDSSFLDGGAPYYSAYEANAGKRVSAGSIEPQWLKNQACQRSSLVIKMTPLNGMRSKQLWLKPSSRKPARNGQISSKTPMLALPAFSITTKPSIIRKTNPVLPARR